MREQSKGVDDSIGCNQYSIRAGLYVTWEPIRRLRLGLGLREVCRMDIDSIDSAAKIIVLCIVIVIDHCIMAWSLLTFGPILGPTIWWPFIYILAPAVAYGPILVWALLIYRHRAKNSPEAEGKFVFDDRRIFDGNLYEVFVDSEKRRAAAESKRG